MIVVTTPTGAIGRQVAQKLVDSGESLRVIVRDESRLAPSLRGRVEVVQGSHSVAVVVDEAFDGADALFWVVPPNAQAESLDASYLDFTRPACDAIRKHSIKHVVGVSALGRSTPFARNAGLVTASLAMDDLFASTDANYRALAMPSFMDNLLRQAKSIKNQGVFFGPIDADRKMPHSATRDIAAVATKLLLDRNWSGNGYVPVLGPDDLSCNDMARIMSEVFGKPVQYQQVAMDAFEAGLKNSGMSEAFIRGYVEMMQAKNQGLDNGEVRSVDNSTPTSFPSGALRFCSLLWPDVASSTTFIGLTVDRIQWVRCGSYCALRRLRRNCHDEMPSQHIAIHVAGNKPHHLLAQQRRALCITRIKPHQQLF